MRLYIKATTNHVDHADPGQICFSSSARTFSITPLPKSPASPAVTASKYSITVKPLLTIERLESRVDEQGNADFIYFKIKDEKIHQTINIYKLLQGSESFFFCLKRSAEDFVDVRSSELVRTISQNFRSWALSTCGERIRHNSAYVRVHDQFAAKMLQSELGKSLAFGIMHLLENNL